MATQNSINVGVVAGGGNTYTFPASTDTLVGRASTDTLTNKTLTTPVINGAITGTGQATAATASTITMRDANGNTSMNNLLEGYATTATAAGTTTLTVSSVYQQYFTGSTTQILALPVASTLVNGQSWYIINNSTGAITINTSGGNQLGILAGSTQAIVTCINTAGGTGVASWNIWYEADTVTAGKKLSVSNTLTLAGTDGQTMTFPSTSATIARTDAAQTFTGVQTVTSALNTTPQTISVTTNAGTADISHGIQNFTNSSAATMTITLTTTSAVDGQFKEVRIFDASAVAQTISWVGTENSGVSAPTTSNGSATLPLSVLFQFNSATSKWRCLASS